MANPTWYLRFFGFAQTQQSFRAWMKAARDTAGADWWVGTVVEYAIYQHFGTRYIQGIPFFTMAIDRVRRKIEADDALKRNLMEAMIKPREDMLQRIAFMLEAEVKTVITEMKREMDRLIDTGNMRASFAAGPSRAQAAAKSAGQAS